MRTYQLQDFANPISVAVTNPSQSGYSRFVGLEHYDSGELVVKRYSGTELLTTTAKAFETNDILIARRNVYLKRAGIVFFDGITSGDTIVLRIKNDCESATGVPKDLAQRIIPIVLNSEHFWIYANKHADGMNSKRISKEMLLTYEFELPSLEEQRVLADKLWAAYEVKESYKNLLAQTDKLLHAQFEKMFGEETNIKLWKDVLTIRNGKAYPKEYLEKGPYPIYGSGGVMGYAEDYLFDEDTIIVGRKGNINNPILVREKYWTVDTAFCLEIDKKILNPIYFYNWCQQFDFTYFNKQGVLPSLTRTDLYTIKMPIPPMEKQLEFVRIAEQAEQTKATLNKGIAAIEAVIRSLIAEGTTKI